MSRGTDLAKNLLSRKQARPWIAATAQFPAACVSHAVWGGSPWIAAGMTLGTVGLSAVTWLAGKEGGKQRKVHATATVAGGGSIFTSATIVGVFDPTMASIMALSGVVGAASWNLRDIMGASPQGEKGKSTDVTTVLKKSLRDAVHLRKEIEVEPNRVVAPIQIEAGQGMTAAGIGHRIGDIAVELGISPDAITVRPHGDRADQADLIFIPVDELKTPRSWPGPLSLGGSITEPIRIGVYKDGEEAVLWFPFDAKTARNGTHFLIAGMSGSGKSAGVSVALADILTRRDVEVWASDPSKGVQTFGPFLPYLDWAETTEAGASRMADVLPAVITARTDALGKAGFKNWSPEAFKKLGMPYLVVLFEEVSRLLGEGVDFQKAVQEARSAGISIVMSLQRPSATTMPTDVREQLGGALVFGVKSSTTSVMALPEDVIDEGARPEAWQNTKPGYAYLVAPGVPSDRYAVPLRTYRIEDDEIGAVLSGIQRPGLDPVTRDAAGEAYERRERYGEEELEYAEVIDDGELEYADPLREIPAPSTVVDFGGRDTGPDLTPQEAEEQFRLLLREMIQRGETVVTPKILMENQGRFGRSLSWVSRTLTAMDQAGELKATGRRAGEYRILIPA